MHSDAASTDGRQTVLFCDNTVNRKPAIAWLVHTDSAIELVRSRQFLCRSLQRDDRQMPSPTMKVDAHAESIARLTSHQRPRLGTRRPKWPTFSRLNAWSTVRGRRAR